MIDTFHRRDAEHAFERALRRGTRDTSILSRIRGRDNRVLRLNDVLAAVPVRGERYVGIEDVPVERIVGTEDRGDDYSRDFHPRKRALAARWIPIYQLLANSDFDEPITAIDVGGLYFVRDGNHRVSVARHLERVFINASVTRYDVPVSLPRHIDRNQIPLLRRKVRFYQRTAAFDVIDERHFLVACPRTWDYLEREMNEFNFAWFVRRFGREPRDREEQLRTWYENLYRHAIDFIRANHVTYLFPGMRETDVFAEMLRLWNSHGDPDEIWLGEVYRAFVRRQRRRQVVRALPQAILNLLAVFFESPEDEYRRFRAISRVDELVPDFRPLPKRRGFYRFLRHELVHRFAPGLKPELGRAPHLSELTVRWHDRFYGPVASHALVLDNPAAQTSFYRRFSRRYLTHVLDGSVEIHRALDAFS